MRERENHVFYESSRRQPDNARSRLTRIDALRRGNTRPVISVATIVSRFPRDIHVQMAFENSLESFRCPSNVQCENSGEATIYFGFAALRAHFALPSFSIQKFTFSSSRFAVYDSADAFHIDCVDMTTCDELTFFLDLFPPPFPSRRAYFPFARIQR